MQAEQVQSSTILPERSAVPGRIEQILSKGLPEGSAVELQLPGQRVWQIGRGTVRFRLTVNNKTGLSALQSMDEIRIAEAYMFGDLDLEGDLVAALDLRSNLTDRHLVAYLWSTYGQKLFFGQTKRDAQWIKQHYDIDSEFHLCFLDKQYRTYSHGYFEHENEPLETAIGRKLTTAFEMAGIKPGMRVLDIGAGWGAFTEFAGKRGAHVTSLTISAESESYCNDLIRRENLPCEVIREHLLEYRSPERFDAIVNLGVTEHLPDYAATIAQYQRLLKPGGRVFLDACATRTKYPFSTFILKYIYPGNATPLHLSSYLDAVSETPFEVAMVHNDRLSYMLTCTHWARNLDQQRNMIVERWGERVYRSFRLYLWGCVHGFATDDITAYRWMLQLPSESKGHKPLTRSTPTTILRKVRKALHL
jgi:cyclopropane-fatty-acyl-phospholipid synthase